MTVSRIERRVEVHRLHPVRVQLRHRGAARRRGRAPARARARRRRAPDLAGYACEKPSRLDYYQNGPHRLTKPLRRRADGSVRGDRLGHRDPRGRGALRRGARRARRRVDLLLRRRRAGEPPARRLRRAARARCSARSTARARSRRRRRASSGSPTKMIGGYSRADFEHCEVALFLGKNPWFSHSIPRARVDAARDREGPGALPDRRRPAPHRDRRDRRHPPPGEARHRRVAARRADRRARAGGPRSRATGSPRTPTGSSRCCRTSQRSPVAEYCAACGVPEETVRATARRIAAASSVATFEDLGVQMNRHSTLVSYLHKLLVLLTGNFGKQGAAYVPVPFVPLAVGKEGGGGARAPHAGDGRARDRRAHALQRDPRGDPHRSSRSASARCSSRAATPRTRSPTARACARRSPRSISWW